MKSRKSHEYKHTKMGMLPGDIPKGDKIELLEHGSVYYNYLNREQSGKTYKRDLIKKANRRFRHAGKKLCLDYTRR